MYFNYNGMTDGSISGGTSSPTNTWYFAEGNTQPGFDEYLTVQNPTEGEANVKFEFMLANRAENKTVNVSVAPHARGTWNVRQWIPNGKDVSVKVTSNVGVIAERPMYFNYHGAWTGGHDNIGLKSLSDEWYLAEGTTRNGFEEWITIQNPTNGSCGVHIYYSDNTGIIGDGIYVVSEYSRVTVNVNKDVGAGKDVSCHIVTDFPIAVERPMYFNYNRWTGGHISSGFTSGD